MNSTDTTDLVAIARVARPRGIKGEVVAEILTDFPARFQSLERVIAVDATGERRELIVDDAWLQNGRVVVKFAGHDSVESAETLRNAELCILESETAELDDGEFFDWELAGCRVETVDGQTVGLVKELMRTGGTELLVVEGEGKEFLVPFAEAICVEVDLENKVVTIDPPEGLLDF